MKGRKPVPTLLKILNGNPGGRPFPEDEPKPVARIPKMPAWLDAAAKKKWKHSVKVLPAGLLTVADGDILAAWCVACVELEVATATIAESGRIQTTENGYMAPHPAVTMQRTAMRELRAYSAMLGFDPAGRTRIHVQQPAGGASGTAKMARKRA